MEMQVTYDPNEAIKVWSDGLSQPKLAWGRKLKFSEKCGILAALAQGAPHRILMQAFDLSSATVSQISTCLNQGSQRYVDVAREWNNLGQEEFRRRYYPEELHWRLMRIKSEAPGPGDIVNAVKGPRKRASKYSFENYGVVSVTTRYHETWHWRIDWLKPKPESPEGWYCGQCHDDRGTHDKLWRGRSLTEQENEDLLPEPQPFRTSSLAFDYVHEFYGVTSPRGGAKNLGD
jgi:hypothetical protein